MQQPSQIRRLIFAVVVMYKFYLNILLLLCCAGSIAQPVNLVPNGSFEDTIDFNNGFLAPKGWDMTLGTPDYFTALFDPPYDSRRTPQNHYAFQYPKNGKSYIGFIVKHNSDSESREYIQIKLKNVLKKDSVYDFSCWINLPDSFHWACEPKNIAFAFSDTMIEYPQHLHKRINELSPGYNSDSIWNPINKDSWERIYRSYKANGDEEYLIVGNFLSDNQTPLVDMGGGNKWVYNIQSYYFIDQIELYQYHKTDTLSTDTVVSKKMVVPNIFTPNADGINDVWKVSDPKMIKEISIYNRWGDFIKKLEEPGFIWEGNDRSPGIYFYKIKYTEKQVEKVKTGTITLIR